LAAILKDTLEPRKKKTMNTSANPQFPGPVSAAMLEELNHYVVMEPNPFVIDIQKSHGMYLATVDGQEIFDWGGYFGSKLLGHNHPGLYEEEYTRRLLFAANNKTANPDYLTRECLDYYRLLHSLAPRCMSNDKLEVYAVNSGAEAVENMMKYLLVLHQEKFPGKNGAPVAHRFLYFDRAFHGRIVFALNVTQPLHDPAIALSFNGFAAGNLCVPFPSTDSSQPPARNEERTRRSLEMIEQNLQNHPREIVGIIVEPIQGAGGHRVAQRQFFRQLSELAHKYDVFLGFDEVQTAGGQTGTMFACDQFDLPHPPQAVAVGKKFANGAVYMACSMENQGVLDSTWGGSLADMVRFVQEMKIVERENLIAQVPKKAAALGDGLQALCEKYPHLLFNVRGMGLYQGFTLRSRELKTRLQQFALQDEQMLLLSGGFQSIRFRPVLDVTLSDIALMLEKLDRCLSHLTKYLQEK
jgi:L-lysine 6-transaminase